MNTLFRIVHGTVTVGNGRTVPVKITKTDDRLPASIIEKGDEPLISISLPYVKATDNGKVKYPYFDLDKKSLTEELEYGDEVVFLVNHEGANITWLCWTHKSEFVAAQQAITTRLSGRKNIVQFVPEDNATYRLIHDNTPFVGTPRQIIDELVRDFHHKEQCWPEGTWEKHNGRKFITCNPPACPALNSMLVNRRLAS